MKVIIAGGGIAGLALGQALKKEGIAFELYERDPGLVRAGYRLHMLPLGGEALRRCLPDALYELYLQTSRANPRRLLANMMDSHGNEVRTMPHLGLSQDGAERPHTAVNRLTLRQILLSGIEEQVHFGARFSGVDASGDTPTLLLDDGRRIEGDVLVAADGINSVVRRALLPEFEPRPVPLQFIYSRAPLTPALRAILPDGAFDNISAVLDRGNLFAIGLWEPREPVADAFARLAPGTPYTDQLPYVMIAATAPTGGLGGADIDTLSTSALKDVLLAETREWSAPLRHLAEAIDPASCFVQDARYLPVARWSGTGGVTFIGDAIHAVPPSAGAGANMAASDAALLADTLVGVAQGKPPATSLRDFEAQMRAVNEPICTESIARLNAGLPGAKRAA